MKVEQINHTEIINKCRWIEYVELNPFAQFPSKLVLSDRYKRVTFLDEDFSLWPSFYETLQHNFGMNGEIIVARFGKEVEHKNVGRRIISDIESGRDWAATMDDMHKELYGWRFGSNVFLYDLDSTFAAFFRADCPTIVFSAGELELGTDAAESQMSPDEVLDNFEGNFFWGLAQPELDVFKKVFIHNYRDLF